MSFKSMSVIAVTAVLATSLVACGQGQQASNAASRQEEQQRAGIASSSVLSSPSIAPETSLPDATLMVQPASIDGCKPNQPIVAIVSWHSREPHVKVMVQGPKQDTPQLFSESGHTGSAKTGPWVIANTKFTLISSGTGAVLAQRTIAQTSCD
jgi:hypothetical protein